METVSSVAFVNEALKGKYIGTPYNKIDCQALVENILKDCGVKNPTTGKAWNWRGSNHMWREAVVSRHSMTEGTPPAGAWVFTIKNDGGEKSRGYHDNMGNAAHVGVYLGSGIVQHSTTGGVQWDEISSKRWTHWALPKAVDFNIECICEKCKSKSICGRYTP